MSILGFFGLLTLLLIMFGALYLSKQATTKQEDQQQRQQRIRTLHADLVDLDELLHSLLIYDRNVELLEAIADKIGQTIEEGFDLLPNDEGLQQDQQKLIQMRTQIAELANEPEDPATPDSDRQIYIMKRQFSRGIKVIRGLQMEGAITETESHSHRSRLLKNALLLEVEAYILQGEEARADGDTSTAANFYKHAKELINQTDISLPDKNERLRDLSQKISSLYVSLPESEESKT